MELNNVQDIKDNFPDEMSAMKYFAEIRWGKWARCVYCGNERCYMIEKGERYKCANPKCYKRFRVTVKTIMEASNLKLDRWFVAIMMCVKTRGRYLSYDMITELNITDKTEFYLSEKIKFVFSNIECIGKSTTEIFNEYLKLSSQLYEKFNEIKESPYYGNPYHIKDITDISDVRQYNILERYTRYYLNVYCHWIWIDFTDPREILSETFLHIKDNGIKEYNADSMIKMIQQTINRMWFSFLKNHPKYNETLKRSNARYKQHIKINITDKYLVDVIKQSKDGKNKTRKEIFNDKELLEKVRNRIKGKRKKSGKAVDFISHFS